MDFANLKPPSQRKCSAHQWRSAANTGVLAASRGSSFLRQAVLS
ncbi:MAG: hypothetical protein ACI9AX_002458, partial [Polaromonas sp.]